MTNLDIIKECRQTGRTRTTTKKLLEKAYHEQMTNEIDISKVLIEGDTATIMGVKYKRVEEPKSPAEEAYKEVYGWYPPTTSSVSNYEDNRWSAFQNGYTSAKEDYEVGEYQPTSQEPEEVADGLKEAFREAVKQGIVSSVDKPKTMTDILYRWWCDVFTSHSDWDMETSIEDLVDRIELFLPKEQSAAGSQNAYVECSVEGFNDCIKKIKSKLR
jgi:hypothetical protein